MKRQGPSTRDDVFDCTQEPRCTDPIHTKKGATLGLVRVFISKLAHRSLSLVRNTAERRHINTRALASEDHKIMTS
jgi:hypothetical protein